MQSKIVFITLITLTVVATNGFADFIISKQFASSPVDRPRGMAWCGPTTFWISANQPASGPNFARFNTDGNLIESFSTTDHAYLGLALWEYGIRSGHWTFSKPTMRYGL